MSKVRDKMKKLLLLPVEENATVFVMPILKTDGIHVFGSNKKVNAWTLRAAVAELPPETRSIFNKIPLSLLFFGGG